MKNCLGKKLLVVCLFLGSIASLANQLHEAEREYEKRGIGLESVHHAKKIYWNILKTSHSIEEKRIAVDRIGRLSVLEGELAPLVFARKAKGRGEIFENCMKATQYISPRDIGQQNPEYYYWRATCMSLRGAYSKKYIMENIFSFSDDLMTLIKTGKNMFPEFDGAGFHRLIAAVYIKSKDVKISGLYRPEEAVGLCDYAIGVNDEYMITYLFKAQALYELKHKKEALNLINNSINRFEGIVNHNGFTSIPNGPENKAILEMMKEFRNKIKK